MGLSYPTVGEVPEIILLENDIIDPASLLRTLFDIQKFSES